MLQPAIDVLTGCAGAGVFREPGECSVDPYENDTVAPIGRGAVLTFLLTTLATVLFFAQDLLPAAGQPLSSSRSSTRLITSESMWVVPIRANPLTTVSLRAQASTCPLASS